MDFPSRKELLANNFDSIEEMHAVYDEHVGHTGLKVNPDGWKLTP